jgi:two-component system phosphate regulon sensor histidine kinase PhoR
VAFSDFLLGLSIGVALLIWQRFQADSRLKKILKKLQTDQAESPFSLASQLSLAISQQRETQSHLEQQIAILKQIIQTAPVGYLQVDDENRLLWCNQQAQSILGIAEECNWSKPRLLLEWVRSYELDDLIEQTRRAEQPCQSNWTFYPTSSDPSDLSRQPALTLQGYGLPLPDSQVGVFLENQQELVMLSQQCDRWTSDLAHELKTPLTSIRLIAETLQSRLEPSLRTWIDRLINETIRLSDLVQDLLALSQMERDAFRDLQRQPTDLVRLIHSVWNSLEPLARRKQIELDYQGPDHLVVQLDESRIHRLLINLLDNAIKYSAPERPIQIKLEVETAANATPEMAEPTQVVCLEVIDSGGGFPEQSLPYVFERFFRADPSRSRLITAPATRSANDPTPATLEPQPFDASLGSTDRQSTDRRSTDRRSADSFAQGGNGLGLAIVRQIVEAHQGSVSASNHPETGGGWLQVRFPCPIHAI